MNVIVKRSPVLMVRNFLALEIAGYAAFLLVGTLADYGVIYANLSLGRILSYQIAHSLFIIAAEIAATLLIFLDWHYTYFQITPQAVTSARGIFFRRKTTIPLEHVRDASHEYGLGGKIFKFGTLVVRGEGGRELRLSYVPDPQAHVDTLMELKHGRRSMPEAPAEPRPVPDAAELLRQGEHEQLEFKSSLRWDARLGRANRELERAAMKTVAAFLNSNGGRLLVGASDSRAVCGLEADYASLPRKDRDGFEGHFTHVFNAAIGAEFRGFVKLFFQSIEGKDVCVVDVAPAPRPVFARFDNAEDFYIRTGNTTTPLKMSEAASYLDRWRGRVS